MDLVNPLALFWLGLAIPLVALYLLKVRPRRAVVPTLLFFGQIFKEKQARSLWRRLRHLVSLLLQLLLLLLLVLALADPVFNWQLRQARRMVLVVDNSASMNATDVAPSRLERARAEGHKVIAGLRPRDEMAVVTAGGRPQVVCGLTAHQASLRQALDGVAPSDSPTQVVEAVALARRLLADGPNREVVLLTDGCFAGAKELAGADDVRLLQVGARTANAGITRFQARRSLVDPLGYEILAEVRNFSDGPLDVRFDLDLEGNPIEVVPLHLEAGGSWTKVFAKTAAAGGRLTAKLDPPDALAADNEARALLPRQQARPVLLVSAPNVFLEKVFEANPLVRLTMTSALPTAPPPGTLTVFHRMVPARLPPGPVFVIDPAGPCELWELGAKLVNPLVDKQDLDSPLLAHLKLDNVLLQEARALQLHCTPKVLIASATGDPLLFAVERPGGNVLVLTVNLDKGDLPLRTAFPILASNALAWFSHFETEVREAVAAGSSAEVDLPAPQSGSAEFLLRAPDGSTRPLRSAGGKTRVGPLDRAGVWSVVSGPESAVVAEIACNVCNPAESDLRGPEGLASAAVAQGAGFFSSPLWAYLLGAAWLLAGLEWYLYQRRWTD
jgi:hypothetical protein